MSTNIIRSIRKGSAQWSEEDRLQLVSILAKAGYAVKIGRRMVPGTETSQNHRWNTQLILGGGVDEDWRNRRDPD